MFNVGLNFSMEFLIFIWGNEWSLFCHYFKDSTTAFVKVLKHSFLFSGNLMLLLIEV